MSFDVGAAYTWSYQFTNPPGNAASSQPANPATASLAVLQPDQTPLVGSPFTITIPPPTLGLLQQQIVPTQPGLHQFTLTTTGPAWVKTDYENFVNYRSIISLAAAKERLGVTVSTTDEKIRLLMAAATREVERVVGTVVPTTFTNELIPGTYRDALKVSRGPIFMPPSNTQANGSVTSLKSAYPQGPSWQAGGTGNILVVTPSPGVIREAGLVPFWYGPWLVTYTGGVLLVEEDIVEGTKEVLYDMWQQMRGLTANLAASASVDAIPGMPFYRMPPRALQLLKGHELPGFG